MTLNRNVDLVRLKKITIFVHRKSNPVTNDEEIKQNYL